MEALGLVDDWPADRVAVGVASARGTPFVHGDAGEFRWASVTKPVTVLACLVAAEEGTLDLDEPAGPPGSTVRHLLAHASGLPFDRGSPIAKPGARRIYSEYGFEVLGETLSARAGMPFAEYLAAAVLEPLGLGARLDGKPGSGLHGSLGDLLAIGRELLAPTLVASETLAEATDGPVPRPGRGPARLRAPGAERLGPRAGAPRSQVPPLDRFAQLGADVRPLRPQRHLPVGRPGARDRARVPHRSGVRRVGDRAWPELSDAVLEELNR